MCGITGFYSQNRRMDTKRYYAAHCKIAHRGPDDEGFIYKNTNGHIEHLMGDDTIKELRDREYIVDKAPSSLMMGHRRLSIIDLSAHGHQPFCFKNLYLVYNGEIYNYIELRQELQSFGYTFETDSDTEVFIKAYHCWEKEAFNKFNGMWAAAIYNHERNDLLLTRDRFGIKPLYYAMIENSLVFGSEIKFVSSFMEKLYANEQMVYEYVRFNYLDHTDQTLFEGIMQVEPNSCMIFSENSIQIFHYWELKKVDMPSKEDIEKSLKSAIKLRLRSDVEVGSLLSGGIDSSTILGIIDQEKYRKKFETFSAVFKEEKFSEKKYIDTFSTTNMDLIKHFIYPEAEKLLDNMEELIYTQEEPFRSLAVFSQYEIYKNIRETTRVTALLNGQGADEIFTGYTDYYYAYLLELLRQFDFIRFASEFKAFMCNRGISIPGLAKQLLITFLSRCFRPKNKHRIFKKKFKVTQKPNKFKNLLKSSLYSSLTFSALREYLRYEDRNSMRFSLESRLPFLDFNVVEKAFSLSDEQKIKNGVSKAILREIAKNKIPDEILYRKDKMGFVSPQKIWQKTLLADDLDKTFGQIRKEGIFHFIDSEQIYSLYEAYKNGHFDDWAFIWRIYCLYKWKKVWSIQ